MRQLSARQVNNLITGTPLAAEVTASSPHKRAFIVIGAYLDDPLKPKSVSKYLNADHRLNRYWLRIFEIDRAHIALPQAGEFEEEKIYQIDITSLEELEERLSNYVTDFSDLEVSWKLDYPI
jgi:hypothetical protein